MSSGHLGGLRVQEQIGCRWADPKKQHQSFSKGSQQFDTDGGKQGLTVPTYETILGKIL